MKTTGKYPILKAWRGGVFLFINESEYYTVEEMGGHPLDRFGKLQTGGVAGNCPDYKGSVVISNKILGIDTSRDAIVARFSYKGEIDTEPRKRRIEIESLTAAELLGKDLDKNGEFRRFKRNKMIDLKITTEKLDG